MKSEVVSPSIVVTKRAGSRPERVSDVSDCCEEQDASSSVAAARGMNFFMVESVCFCKDRK